MLFFGFIMMIFGGVLYYRGKAVQTHRDVTHLMSVTLRVTGIVMIGLGLIFMAIAIMIIGYANV